MKAVQQIIDNQKIALTSTSDINEKEKIRSNIRQLEQELELNKMKVKTAFEYLSSKRAQRQALEGEISLVEASIEKTNSSLNTKDSLEVLTESALIQSKVKEINSQTEELFSLNSEIQNIESPEKIVEKIQLKQNELKNIEQNHTSFSTGESGIRITKNYRSK